MAKPTFDQLKAKCPDLDESLISAHLERLDEEYFNTYSPDAVARHLYLSSQINAEQFACVATQVVDERALEISISANYVSGIFSYLCGILSASGLNIISGSIFTFKKSQKEKKETALGQRRGKSRYFRREHTSKNKTPLIRRRIIDVFLCQVSRASEVTAKDIQDKINQVLSLCLENKHKEARKQVDRWVGELFRLRGGGEEPLLSSDIKMNFLNKEGTAATLCRITAPDSPAFLYILAFVFSEREIDILKVKIQTRDNKLTDELLITDRAGRPILKKERLDTIRLYVILTKQFTRALFHGADPGMALEHFEQLLDQITTEGTLDPKFAFIKEGRVLDKLSRILGASDFLWAEIFRRYPAELLPLLREGSSLDLAKSRSQLCLAFEKERKYNKKDDFKTQLNHFKDKELFRIDMRQVLEKTNGFMGFADELTECAEALLFLALEEGLKHLKKNWGFPQVGAEKCRWELCGLGKMGGSELGYASDIEIVLIYEENGETTGGLRGKTSNQEFFNGLVQQLLDSFQSRHEGIFELDLRLRPDGKQGPLATSLARFESYFQKEGPAHDYERQALVRLRALSKPKSLFSQKAEEVRDKILYQQGGALDSSALAEMRDKQLKHLVRPDKINVKFSAGGLVDIEYLVQYLQVLHGGKNKKLRTPATLLALDALQEIAVLSVRDFETLLSAYSFYRVLINGLRMLRGNTKDLLVPEEGSLEFLYLARRMHLGDEEPEAKLAEKLHQSFANVRELVQHYRSSQVDFFLGKGYLSDLILRKNMSEEEKCELLKEAGFQEGPIILQRIKRMGTLPVIKRLLARVLLLSQETFRQSPDSDMLFRNWERFTEGIPALLSHYNDLIRQPERRELLFFIFAYSQFLSDALIQYPGDLEWILDGGAMYRTRSALRYARKLKRRLYKFRKLKTQLKHIRLYRRSELLRIGVRDFWLKKPFESIIQELSDLAQGVLMETLKLAFKSIEEKYAWPIDNEGIKSRYAVFALGKLGGRELNYSSDLDLIAIYDGKDGFSLPETGSDTIDALSFFTLALELGTQYLTDAEYGAPAYRIDFRLRPFGSQGELVTEKSSALQYYRHTASPWEYQALIKLRFVAGDEKLAEEFENKIKRLVYEKGAQSGFEKLYIQVGTHRILFCKFQMQIRFDSQVRHQYLHRNKGIKSLPIPGPHKVVGKLLT